MQITVQIDDGVMARLRQVASESGGSISGIVETALRQYLWSPPNDAQLPELPSFVSGGLLVDVADRDAPCQKMEER